MKICLLDPGLRSLSGHHVDWVHQLAREASRRGARVLVGCAKDASTGLLAALAPLAEVIPMFSLWPYHHDRVPASFTQAQRDAHEMRRHTHESQVLAGELQALPPSDLWLFPTLYAAQAAACALVPMAPAMAACIHKTPDLDGPAGARSWQQALQALARRSNAAPICLGTTTPPLQQAYAALSALPVQVWPLAHDGLRATRPRQHITTVGILGHQRPEKGLAILPPLVARLLELGLKVLLHDASGQLRAPSRPGLQLVSGFVTDFPAMVNLCDLIVVPNDPASYRLSGSGPVWEAMACGVPVLAPRGCYPGDLVQSTGAGLCFDAPTPEAIVRTVRDAIHHYPRLAGAAFACSQQWLEHQGVGRFLDRVLSLSKAG